MAIRTTYAQLERLIEFMEETPQLAKGQMRCNLSRFETMLKWHELANIMNNMDGQKKTPSQWCRYWADKKFRLRRRQVAQRNANAYRQRIGMNDETPKTLSNHDDRILMLVGGLQSEPSKKKKETVKHEEKSPEPKPSTSRARSTRASQDSVKSKKRIHADTVQAVGWCKTARALKDLANAVVQCGHIIADAMVNRAA